MREKVIVHKTPEIRNCLFRTMYHSRWGRVRTVDTMEEVGQGQELLVDYGYDLLRCPE